MHRKRVAGIQLKRLPDHGLAPCNMGCVVCDLITRGAGNPRPGKRGNGFCPDLEKESPESWSESSGLMESRRYPGRLIGTVRQRVVRSM
jgi:hypothetical protein